MQNDSVSALRAMMLIRAFETALAKRKDHGFQLLSTGEEAVAVGLCEALAPEDQLLTGGRSIGAALARGLDPGRVMAELLGKAVGTNKGKGGRGHISEPASGFFGAHAVVAGNISIAAGVALSRQITGQPGLVAVIFGDGASGAGALHEVMNIAALWRLPLLLVCNNNQLSVSTPRSAALAPKALSDLAAAYGIRGRTVDGMDVDEVRNAAVMACEAIRSGEGPVFLEYLTLRFASHSTTARETRSFEHLQIIRQKCPIELQIRRMRDAGLVDNVLLQDMNLEIADIVARAETFSDDHTYPAIEEALTDVW